MRYLSLYTFFFLFVTLVLFPQGQVLAASGNIILSEISIAGDSVSDEFIELYNAGDTEQDLKDFKLATMNTTNNSEKLSIKSFSRTSFILKPGQYYIWANSGGEFFSFADTTTSVGLAKNNTFGLFYRPDPKQSVYQLVGSFSWDNDDRAGTSATRDLDTLTWQFTPTITPTNSHGEVYQKRAYCSEKSPRTPLFISELFPHPKESTDEFIEFYNPTATDVSLKNWKVRDKTTTYSFKETDSIQPGAFFLLPKSESDISLNDSDERVTLFDATENVIDEICYQTTKEGVSINFTETGWRGGVPTPNTLNQPNLLPETREKVPQKGYRDMPVSFDARGKDQDGGTLKYTWDFGDDHKSYKEETEHTYEENGSYQVTLTTNDGKDDVVETFTIKIESFPKLDIRITALSPNPTGSDSEHEWVLIENREKESIDLKGFSIATGWDKLINHPIRKSFVIKGKSSATLTREFSLFTLPNKKGRIELRGPNGKTIQEIEYKEKESIDEDMVYRKEKGKRWAWKNEKIALPQPAESSETESLTTEETSTTPVESALEEIKSTDPQVASTQAIDQETLRKEFYRLLHHHAWVDISNTSPSSQSVPPTNFRNLLAKTNSLLNQWQNK